jgi:ribosomal protein S18 acetylase RimI-like enzyme
VIVVRALERDDEAEACARIMSTSEPWMTLRRDFAASIAALRSAAREVYVAARNGSDEIVGFLILDMRGAFVGYIQSLGIREDWRGKGLGSRLIGFAEARIFRDSPNVFICVSSFNDRARALYERLGYSVVGELRDYIVQGHSEWLLRKSISPIADWTTSNGPLAFGSRRAP